MYSLDIEKKQFSIDVNFPKLEMEGEYDVNLVILNLPIKSTGPVYINVSKYNNWYINYSKF